MYLSLTYFQLMKVMGLKSGITWSSWFMSSFGWMVIMSAIATLFFVLGKVVLHSDGFILFLYFVTFSLSSTMFW